MGFSCHDFLMHETFRIGVNKRTHAHRKCPGINRLSFVLVLVSYPRPGPRGQQSDQASDLILMAHEKCHNHGGELRKR